MNNKNEKLQQTILILKDRDISRKGMGKRILELANEIIKRENELHPSSKADLGFITLYAKEISSDLPTTILIDESL